MINKANTTNDTNENEKINEYSFNFNRKSLS